MKRWMKRALGGLAGVILVTAGAGFALDGPQQAMRPTAMGLTQVAEGVWIDNAQQADAALADLRAAEQTIAAFYGQPPRPPRLILCTTEDCADRLGLRSRGLTYGAHLVLISPKGMNDVIMAHELSHVALHQSYGFSDTFGPRFPSWFDEGLAVLLSGDDRFAGYGETDWISEARGVRDWARLLEEHGWQALYGAAAARVARIEGVITREGLAGLIYDVENGGDFDKLLAIRMDAAS